MLDYLDYKFRKKLKSIDIKKELKNIFDKGFIESIGNINDGDVGDTLQNELGIPRNNKKYPDFLYGFKPIELKSKRRYKKRKNEFNNSMISLFTTNQMGGPMNSRKIFKKYAYVSQGKLSLKGNIYYGDYKKQGFKLDINNDKLIIKKKKHGQISHFEYSVLLRHIKKKINYLLLVKAENKIIDGIEYFNYNEAYLYSHFVEDKFTNLLTNKKIIANFRMGSNKDHNFGFRIYEKDLDTLYKNKEQIILKSSPE